MSEPPPRPDEETPPERTLAQELMSVFCWGVWIGIISPVIVIFFFELWWGIPEVALWGGCFGGLWGVLTAIVSEALSRSRFREAATCGMLAALAGLSMVATWFVIRVGAA